MKHQINQDTKLTELSPTLVAISAILDDMMPEFLKSIDVSIKFRHTLSLVSVVRLAIYKVLYRLTFRKLADATGTDLALRTFAQITDRRRVDKSTLQEGISSMSISVFELLNIAISKAYADLSRVRIDSSSISANVAPPENNNLLFRAVARVGRIQTRIESLFGGSVFCYRSDPDMAKQLSYQIRFSKPKTEQKNELYIKLILQVGDLSDNITGIIDSAIRASSLLGDKKKGEKIKKLIEELEFLGEKISCVIYQSIAWLQNEKLEADDKLLTIANDMEHVDVIVKCKRKVIFGHKIDIVESQNGIIISLTVYNGNPADSSNIVPIIEMLQRIYGESIKRFVADGGYNSVANYEKLRKIGIEQSVFTRKRSLTLEQMGVTEEGYKEAKSFRTGIERAFSRLKKCFGFEKVVCTTFQRFHLYLIIGVLAANLKAISKM